MHLPGIPPEVAEQIRNSMKRPEGTVAFLYWFEKLFDPSMGNGVILEVVTGGLLFRLERDARLNMHFIYSSPGTGTRVASVDLYPLTGSESVRIIFMWSNEQSELIVADANCGERLVRGKGRLTGSQFRVATDGSVIQLGDEGVSVMEARVYQGGKPVLEPTAIEAWNNTLQAIEVLLTGTSTAGFIYECVCTNLILVMLVTGYEVYCKRRFLELEEEGLTADFDSLVTRFLSRHERDRGEELAVKQDAVNEGISPSRKLIDQGRINFQNYEHCKDAFNKGYGISFGRDLSISNTILEELQRMIKFRHRIVHVSASLGILNQEKVPPEQPVFPNRQYAEQALNTFKDFVQALHTATLRLRPRENSR